MTMLILIQEIFRSFLIASLLCFLYHQFLKISFYSLLARYKNSPKTTSLILISAFRVLIIASLFYLMIVKLRQNIWGIVLALIVYQLVLILAAFVKQKSTQPN